MHLLYIHQFFAGPSAPGPAQPRNLVALLAERGHCVDVVACDFNAYSEQDEPEERIAGTGGGWVRVHRLPTPRGLRASLVNRLQTYGRFAWSAYRYADRLPRTDVVMGTIQPLFGGFAAMRLARRWGRPFLLEIRDLWPDALVAKQAIAGWQAAPLERMARSMYFGADRVVCLTPGLQTEILKKGVPANRVDLLPNGFDSAMFRLPTGARESTRERYGWGAAFVAVYTGTHTEVTAIDVIVRAGMHLRDRPDIRIELFGSGQTKPAAMALARELGLGNVHFHDPVPKSQIPGILAGADAGLMTLFHSPLIHIYFENKLIDYMGAGKPILAAMGGVQASLIEREGAGRVVAGLDDAGLARLIREAADDPAGCRRMGEAGRAFVTANLAQEVILARYADVLESLVRPVGERPAVWDPLGLS